LGSQVGSVDNIHTQGFRQSTGNPLDFAIEGNGMFVVTDGTTTYYTRAGNFYLDDNGDIVSADGLYLQSVEEENINIPEDARSFSVAENGTVTYVDADGNSETAGQIALARFSNPSGLDKVGSNLFLDTNNAGLTDEFATPEQDGMGKIVASALEMSNVDLAEEFTEMIIAQRAFQGNTRVITTSDEILQELVNLKR